VRVIAGEFRGRRLRSARAPGLRPTADRVKEALFSILADVVRGAPVVDLFAGTGGLGIEALSRGARSVTFVERDPRLAGLVEQNLASLGVAHPSPRARVERTTATRWLRWLNGDPELVLIADPPYAQGAPELLAWIRAHPEGYAAAALEHPAGEAPGEELEGVARRDRRTWGNVGVTIFTPLPESPGSAESSAGRA
jgi:16S rRNA (guanine966-N2)-methyltransferase